MKVYELMSAIEGENPSGAVQMDIVKDAGLPEKLAELISSLTGVCKWISNSNVEEMKMLMNKKGEIIDKAQTLEKMLKRYEEDEAERIAMQESLSEMQENIEKRSNADERYETFSGIQYIKETGALIEQYGEKTAEFSKLNERLNDGREEYHRCKAEHLSQLGEIELLRAKIDKLQHLDAEKADMTLTIELMISVLSKVADTLTSARSVQGGNEASIETADLLKQFRKLVPMLEAKLRDYASVLPEKFMEEMKKIL